MEQRLTRLEERDKRSQEEIGRLYRKLDEVCRKVDDIRMDLHAAKVGGRWVIGIAVAFGSLLGWLFKPWLDG